MSWPSQRSRASRPRSAPANLIPLCHTLLLQQVELTFQVRADGVQASVCEVVTVGRTGAEMEALTGVSVAALTIYDMCKAVDKTMRIGDVILDAKNQADHRLSMTYQTICVGIITVSDRAAAG